MMWSAGPTGGVAYSTAWTVPVGLDVGRCGASASGRSGLGRPSPDPVFVPDGQVGFRALAARGTPDQGPMAPGSADCQDPAMRDDQDSLTRRRIMTRWLASTNERSAMTMTTRPRMIRPLAACGVILAFVAVVLALHGRVQAQAPRANQPSTKVELLFVQHFAGPDKSSRGIARNSPEHRKDESRDPHYCSPRNCPRYTRICR